MPKGLEVAQAYVTIIPSMEGIQGKISKGLNADEVGAEAGGKLGSGLGKGILNATGKVAAAVAKTVAAGTVAATAAVAALSKAALDSYSDYEQLWGGAKQIFSDMDVSKIAADAQSAYKDLGMSANEYLTTINQTGAAFKATMGDEKGYETAKRGMTAISNYASGTGRNLGELNEKYAMITRSTSSYQSIADQFSGILPATSAAFLEQAQAAGLLSGEYKSLTEVPIDEYQYAVTAMLEKGVDALGLTGNTAREATETISGSMDMLKASWSNLLVELGKDDGNIEARVGEVVDSALAVIENVAPRLLVIVGALISKVPEAIMQNAPKIAEAVTSLLDGATNGAFSNVLAKLQPGMEKIGAAVSGLMDRLAPLAPYAQQIASAFGSVLITAFNAVADVISYLAPIIASIAEHAMPVLADVCTTVADAFDVLVSALEPVYDFFYDKIASAIDFVCEKFEQLFELFTGGCDAIGEAIGGMGDFFDDPLGSVLNFGKQTYKTFADTGKKVTRTSSRTEKSVSKSFDKMYDSGTSDMKGLQKSSDKSFTGIASTAGSAMKDVYNSVFKQTGNAATASEKNSARVSKSWNKKYTMNLTAEASTSTAEQKLTKFKSAWDKTTIHFNSSGDTSGVEGKMWKFWNSWHGSTVNFNSSGDTSGAEEDFNRLIRKYQNMTINFNTSGSGGGGAFAAGAIIQRHAQGFIANKPGRGVDITRHIAGEAGAEAIIPLTNKNYVRPFAETVADCIDSTGVTITGNTFVVRNDRDIAAIGRAISQEVDRQRRSQL